MNSFPFRIDARHGQARATTITLGRGIIETPVYMPVGTQGAIRGVSPLHLADTGTQILLANTYHLSQRPGEQLVEKAGGLHKFMAIDKPILTDSGGFQVFSLEKTVTEEGVEFAYELDGQRTFLSPERSMVIQQALGSDIAMVFDECLAFGTEKSYAEKSVDRTARWEDRCKRAHNRPDQSLFGIIQGGFWPDLRKRSAEQVTNIGFDGYAIGGLSVGEGLVKMNEVLDWTVPHMPEDAPRYLMGVGRPQDLVEAVARGVDMFDCVIQTRHARSGVVYTSRGRVRLTDRRFRRDFFPIDASCSCYACRTFSRAYLHHLFRVGDILAMSLAAIHNIHWFHDFMRRMRQSIVDGSFEAFRSQVHVLYPETGGATQEEAGEDLEAFSGAGLADSNGKTNKRRQGAGPARRQERSGGGNRGR